MLSFLYETVPGRLLLKPLTGKTVSDISGRLLDTRLSMALVPLFARINHIDTAAYETENIRSFNDFFSRRIKPGKRSIDTDPAHLIAPCDGLLSVWKITGDTVIPVKQSRFTVPSLLEDADLARKYEGGLCLVYRLCVDHYHRYCYVDSGQKSANRHIAGKYHTVRPIALRSVRVFTENTREYTLIRSEAFGTIVQMEVGAMLVGRIRNHEGAGTAVRGREKGLFEYGGSTVIVLLQKDCVQMLSHILHASEKGVETPVRMGEAVGLVRPASF